MTMLAVALLTILASIQLQPLNWPLNPFTYITSQFCEYRGARFHGGIDLSTFRKRGLEVYAVADGFIYRIKYSHAGLGRAIYIRHKNGLISVYGHLHRFENRILKLEDLLARLQKERGRKYIGDYYLERPIFVRKGQLIAYSGQSGAGPPHLHFELRKDEFSPINPLLFLPKVTSGNLFVPRVLLFTADAKSHVAFKRDWIVLQAKPGLRKIYFGESLPVDGCFRIALNAFEKCNTGKCGIFSLKTYWDGNVIYTWKAEEFTYRENYKAGLIYNLFFSRNSRFYYNIPPLNKSPFCVKEGEHVLRIDLSTFDGTGSSIFLKFQHQRNFDFELKKLDGNLWKVVLPPDFDWEIQLYKSEKWIRVKKGKGSEAVVNSEGAAFVRARGRKDGFYSHWLVRPFVHGLSNRILPPIEILATLGWKRISFTDPFVVEKERIEARKGVYQLIIPPQTPISEVLPLDIKEKIVSFPHQLHIGKALFLFPQNSYPLSFSVVAIEERAPIKDKIPFRSSIIRLMPYEVALSNPFKIIFSTQAFAFNSKVAVFYRKGEGSGWVCLPTRLVGRRAIAKINTFGDFALREDNVAPRIKVLYPKKGRRYRKVSRIVAIVKDEGCGVNPEKIYFFVDGKKFIPDHDWDSGLAELEVSLGRGKHRLQIIAHDWKENVSYWVGNFYVNR